MSQTCCTDNKFSPDMIRIGQLHKTARGHTLIRRIYCYGKKNNLAWCVILHTTRFLFYLLLVLKKYISTDMYMIDRM